MSDLGRPADGSGQVDDIHLMSRRKGPFFSTSLLFASLLAMTGCDKESSQSSPVPPPATKSAVAEEASTEFPAQVDLVAPSGDVNVTATNVDAGEEMNTKLGDSQPHVERPEPTTPEDQADQTGETIARSDENDSHGQDDQKDAWPIGPFRLLLPTTAGPLLVDLVIRIGDLPLADVFDQRIESVIEAAGGGDELTWNGLLEYVSANPQTFGRSRVESQQYRNMIQMYDRNRNMRPEPDEIAHFLFRESGYAGPFRMVGSNYFRQTNRSQSPLFLAMDSNGNQAIEEDEIRLAHQSLTRLDQNGDRRIDVTEILPLSRVNELNNDAWNRRRNSRWGDVAMDLSGFVDWSMVAYSLDEVSRQAVFGVGKNAIAAIDQNGDGSIDQDEAKLLLEIAADLRLTIDFASSTSSEPRIDAVLSERDQNVTIESAAAGDRLRIATDQFQLLASVRDTRGGPETIPAEAFAALDADKDGGLDENEIPAGALREYSFDDLDQDDDGKLSHRELIEGMNPVLPIWSVQVRARGAEAPDAIFTWLDHDQNGLLSTRELLACDQRLHDLPTRQDVLRASDFPDTFVIQFGRGDPQLDQQLFAATPRVAGIEPSWPRWAQSMDSNQDGDISRDEFLGQMDQFHELDRDDDGFLSASEIE